MIIPQIYEHFFKTIYKTRHRTHKLDVNNFRSERNGRNFRIKNGERIETEKVTGSDGKFSFPEVTKSKGLFSFLPGEFVASQELIIRFEGREYQGWISTKRSMEANSETGGRPFELICNLNEDPDYHDKSFGVCQLVDS